MNRERGRVGQGTHLSQQLDGARLGLLSEAVRDGRRGGVEARGVVHHGHGQLPHQHDERARFLPDRYWSNRCTGEVLVKPPHWWSVAACTGQPPMRGEREHLPLPLSPGWSRGTVPPRMCAVRAAAERIWHI